MRICGVTLTVETFTGDEHWRMTPALCLRTATSLLRAALIGISARPPGEYNLCVMLVLNGARHRTHITVGWGWSRRTPLRPWPTLTDLGDDGRSFDWCGFFVQGTRLAPWETP